MNLIVKLLDILDRREKIQVVVVFVLILFGAVLETIGIGLIPPFISLLGQPELIKENQGLNWVYQTLPIESTNQLLILLAVGLILFYALKNVYLSLHAYIQYIFLFSKQVTISRRLLSAYIFSPYTFHLERNPAELIRNLTNEIQQMFISVLSPGLILLTEVMVISLILFVLIIFEPLVTLVAVAVIGVTGFGFSTLIRKKVSQLGKIRQEEYGKILQSANQILGGIKEIKVLGRENYFLNQFIKHSSVYAHGSGTMLTISSLPRLFLEGIAVIAVMGFILWMLIQGRDIQSVLPTLSLFAIAAFRLMPSANRIVSTLTQIRYYRYSVDVLHHDLMTLKNVDQSKSGLATDYSTTLPIHSSITLHNVYYRYPKAKADSIRGISLSISKGQWIGLVGASGAGKTTLVDVILGLLTPTQGQVVVDDQNIQANLFGWQRQIGYIPQTIYLTDDTIGRNIAFGVPDKEIDEHQLKLALKAAQLLELVESLPAGLETLVGDRGVRLSGGQRQRIGIARALYHNPQVLVMDEATAALDNETEKEITQALESLSGEKTMITIAHRLSTIKNCDCLYLFKAGEIIGSGSYNELLAKNSEFRKLAGSANSAPSVPSSSSLTIS